MAQKRKLTDEEIVGLVKRRFGSIARADCGKLPSAR